MIPLDSVNDYSTLGDLRGQMVRFAVVGVTSNVLLYLLYLLLTSAGLGYKVSMTLLYFLAVLQTFLGNRAWTFRHIGDMQRSLVRYFSSYAIGYLLNFVLLYVFVDRFGLAHQWVQAGAIIGIALLLFLLQKYWVFWDSSHSQFGKSR